MRKTIFKKLEAQGLITNYNRLRKNLPPHLPERVFIQDETFREGIKPNGNTLNKSNSQTNG
jgi:hypothetical protein